MRSFNWLGIVAGSGLFFQLGCAEILGLLDRPIDDDPGTTTTTTGQGGTGGTGGAGGVGGTEPPCSDSEKNGDETDLDCGGGTCPKCSLGKGCIVGPDCESNVCLGGTCVAPGCTDQIKNADETDVDCGGPICSGCANGLMCKVDQDCESGVCKAGICKNFLEWSKAFEADASSTLSSVASDKLGNVFFGFSLGAPLNVGGGLLNHEGLEDIGIAKLDGKGDHQWSKSFGDLNAQTLEGLAVDQQGGVVLAGSLSGTTNFGGADLTSGGGCCPASPDALLVKLDDTGKHVWSKNFGNSAPQLGLGVAVDNADNVLLVGSLAANIDFGGGTLSSAGAADAFVAKFDAAGNHLWSRRYGEALDQIAYKVATDKDGNVFVAGLFQGGLNLGNGPLEYAGGADVFVAKLDMDGNLIWSRGVGSTLDEANVALAADGDGNVYLGGAFQGTISFSGDEWTSAGANDLFVLKLNSGGEHVWSKRFGDKLDQSVLRMAVDDGDNVLLTGGFQGAIDFGGGELTALGDTDVFVAKLNGGGEHLWSHHFGDEKAQVGKGIVGFGAEQAYFSVQFDGTLDLGGEPLVSVGGNDIFVGLLNLP